MLKVVPINAIKVGSVKTDADHVKALAASFAEIDVLEPLLVNEDYELLCGAHRWRAAKLAGLEKVPVHVLDLDDVGQRMAQLDENLLQKHRSALELAELLREKKELYEAKHPEAKQGGDRSKRKSVPSAASVIAKKNKRTERSVRQYVEVAEKVTPKAKKKLKGTEAANSITDLQRLAKMEPEAQVEVAERVAETGESVKQAAKALKHAEQVKQAREYVVPEGEYAVLVVDPPWPYEDELDGSDAARGGTPYPAMKIAGICDLKLPVAQDAAVFLWVTNSHLIDETAYGFVAQEWRRRYGLVPKGIVTWEKDRIGLGRYFRNKTEHLVLFVRGKPVFTDEKPWSHFRAPVGEHSEKPEAAYLAIEKFCASTSRLEMFARAPRKGWVTTGSELEAAPAAARRLDEVTAQATGRHNICVADEATERGQLDRWVPRCTCGWEGDYATEAAADVAGSQHKREAHP